ncbi:AP-4 complex subunit epsilon-1-like [Ruditapes philippinarum]|uniref:AP-4 complex subunit epsilon-1-like n=1 Tax=Ruditapes philippinarum TaxID=129788 RepID=UPI00295C2371|nr:AP-4 complex subunit epsilon-1-like [Ruditapes philippinarum]
MSNKSFSVLPKFFGNLVGTSPPTEKSIEGISRGFELFVQSVHRAKNKYDEQQIVNRELQTIKSSIGDASQAQMRDYLWRLVYARMIGYDVEFGCIEGAKLAGRMDPIDSKTGFMISCLLMNRTDEITLLLMCTFQKNITSSNLLEILMGLSACSQLTAVHSIPYILDGVLSNLKHSRELVRQKAVLCLHQFQLLAPDLLEHRQEDLERMLYDKDPGVMAAAVHIIQHAIERDPTRCQRFGETLVSILTQISSHKMASMFEYQSVPFPWLQVQIIKCLTKLAKQDESFAASLVPFLKEILQRTSRKEMIALSIVYECLQCILSINPPKHLLDVAAVNIRGFILSSNANMKFIGVKLLTMLVRVNPKYAFDYQQLIVQSLDNPDTNVQRKTHKLLYEITNETNVTTVCAKLFTQLQTSSDKFWRSEVITMVLNILERYDGDVGWRVERLFTCLQLGNDIIEDTTLKSMMCLIEEKFMLYGADERRQKLLVQKCVEVLVNKNSPTTSLHIATWVLGELCPILKNMPDDKVISLFTRHLGNEKLGYSTQSCIVTALQNLVIKGVVNCDNMSTKINECLMEQLPIVIKQSLSVLLGVCKYGLTITFSGNIDTTLTFLDDLVTDDLEQGGKAYIPPHLRGVTSEPEASPGLFSGVMSEPTGQDDTYSSGRPRTESNSSSMKTAEESESVLKVPSVKRVWGKQGRLDISPKTNMETSSLTTSVQTEEEKRQQELASALFGGFQSTEENDVEELSGFLSGSSDTANWRNLHTSATRTNTIEQSTEQSTCIGQQDLCNDKISDIETVKNTAQDSFTDNSSSCDTGLLHVDTEHISIFSESETLVQVEQKEPLFGNGNNFGENSLDCFDIKDRVDDKDKAISSDNDLEQAFSALFDSRSNESKGMQASGVDKSIVQTEFGASSEQITGSRENTENGIGGVDNNNELRTNNSIYDETW